VIIFLFLVSFCKGVLLPPRLAHSALWGVEYFFCSSLQTEGRRLVSYVFPRPHIPWGWMALSGESNQNTGSPSGSRKPQDKVAFSGRDTRLRRLYLHPATPRPTRTDVPATPGRTAHSESLRASPESSLAMTRARALSQATLHPSYFGPSSPLARALCQCLKYSCHLGSDTVLGDQGNTKRMFVSIYA
jgi:hypothetical protein